MKMRIGQDVWHVGLRLYFQSILDPHTRKSDRSLCRPFFGGYPRNLGIYCNYNRIWGGSSFRIIGDAFEKLPY